LPPAPDLRSAIIDSVDTSLLLVILVGIFTTALLVLADLSLALLASVPACAAVAVSLVMESDATGACLVAVITTTGSLVLVRAFPSPSRPWAIPAATATVALACVAARVLGVTSLEPIGAGLAVASVFEVGLLVTLRRIFDKPWVQVTVTAGSAKHRKLVLDRYARLPPTIRFWAAAKMRLDPLFQTLHEHAPSSGTVLDVGCGYALPDVWLAVLHPGLQFEAFDLSPRRARVAGHVLDRRGGVRVANALTFGDEGLAQGPFDAALCIDVLHQLRDPGLMLRHVARRLAPGAVLLLRTTVQSGAEERTHRVERWMVRLRGQRTAGFHTTEQVENMLSDYGYETTAIVHSDARRETLFVARRSLRN
jgi:2-polyprenyl-3-methyl-5-hydroxy-6-metoxy-1,4-benzoquinol methylase